MSARRAPPKCQRPTPEAAWAASICRLVAPWLAFRGTQPRVRLEFRGVEPGRERWWRVEVYRSDDGHVVFEDAASTPLAALRGMREGLRTIDPERARVRL